MPTPEQINRALADELTSRYKGRRLTQADLVERTGINATTMQRILAGKSVVPLPQLWVLAEALDTTPDTLVTNAIDRINGSRV